MLLLIGVILLCLSMVILIIRITNNKQESFDNNEHHITKGTSSKSEKEDREVKSSNLHFQRKIAFLNDCCDNDGTDHTGRNCSENYKVHDESGKTPILRCTNNQNEFQCPPDTDSKKMPRDRIRCKPKNNYSWLFYAEKQAADKTRRIQKGIEEEKKGNSRFWRYQTSVLNDCCDDDGTDHRGRDCAEHYKVHNVFNESDTFTCPNNIEKQFQCPYDPNDKITSHWMGGDSKHSLKCRAKGSGLINGERWNDKKNKLILDRCDRIDKGNTPGDRWADWRQRIVVLNDCCTGEGTDHRGRDCATKYKVNNPDETSNILKCNVNGNPMNLQCPSGMTVTRMGEDKDIIKCIYEEYDSKGNKQFIDDDKTTRSERNLTKFVSDKCTS